MQSEVSEAFRDLGVAEDKAVKAATALSRRDTDVSKLTHEVSVMKWMMGFVLAFQVASFVKMFVH